MKVENKNNLERSLKEAGYKYLGYRNAWHHVYFDEDHKLCSVTGKPRVTFGYIPEEYPEYCKAHDEGHNIDEKQITASGSEVIYSCDDLKIYWKVDMSD